MKTIGEKLRDARLAKGMKQSEVAEKLACAPTSLTNWERSKVMPSMDVLSKLCEIYDLKPLSLLDEPYDYEDIVRISEKPVSERTYEEQIALTFSAPILSSLVDKDRQKKENERIEKTASFIQETDLLNRFGGKMTREDIDPLLAEYDKNGGADTDILFAYHILTKENKRAFFSMLSGLIADCDNVQPFNDKINNARMFTLEKLSDARMTLSEK